MDSWAYREHFFIGLWKFEIFFLSSIQRWKRENGIIFWNNWFCSKWIIRVHYFVSSSFWNPGAKLKNSTTLLTFVYYYCPIMTKIERWTKCISMISRWCPGYLNYWIFSPEIRHLPPDFSDKKVEISKHDQIDPTSTIKILTKKQKWKNENFKYVAYMHCFKDIINNRKYFLHFIRLLLPPKSPILPNLGGDPYSWIP